MEEVKGIKREKKRRKMNEMEKMGWLKSENNLWCMEYEGDEEKINKDMDEVIER